MESNETPKINHVVERIPDKIVEKLDKIKADIEETNNEFFQLATQLVGIQERLALLKKRREEKSQSYNSTLDFTAGKLRLKKRTEYNWRYNGRDAFIGIEVPKPAETPTPEESPKGE